MFKRSYQTLIVSVLLMMGVALTALGCGRKAPPVPPRQEKPPAVENTNVMKQHQDEQQQVQPD